MSRCGITIDDIQRKNKLKLFFDAVACGYAPLVSMVMSERRWDVNKVLNGKTALSLASTPAVVKLLLDAKAKVDADDTSVILAACKRLQPDAVKMLLDAGANTRDYYLIQTVCRAPCTDAQVRDKVALLQLLLGAKRAKQQDKSRDYVGISTLHDVMRERNDDWTLVTGDTHHDAVLKVLLAHDPSLLEKPHYSSELKFNQTPLVIATESNSVSPTTVRVLLEAGADTTAWTQEGRLAFFRLLFGWCSWSHIGAPLRFMREKLRLLLGAGADPRGCFLEHITVMMALVSPKSIRRFERKSVWDGMTMFEVLDLYENEDEYYGNSAVEKIVEDYYASDDPQNTFSDAQCSIFIGDIAEGILAGAARKRPSLSTSCESSRSLKRRKIKEW
jgi:hypothetical protein